VEYVIIGNGVSAIGAVEGIRQMDTVNPITIVSAEPYKVYGRPLISHLLAGKIKEADIFYCPDDYYDRRGVKLLLGTRAAQIIPKKQNVVLNDGSALSFDRLLIATGGIPFIPPLEGKDGPDIYTFTTLDDVRKLEALVGKAERITVIGGGLIGLKVSESLHDRRFKVTVVELADRILSTAFDQIAGEIVRKRLTEVGIEVILQNSIKEIVRANGHVKEVILNDGARRDCDAVVIAIGVVPDISLVEGTGIKTNRGILTDDFMETNIPGIYTAGDVAETHDLLLGQRRVTPIWPNAYLQGQYAGLNMAGAKIAYCGSMPMNSIEFYGIPTISIGLSNPSVGEDYDVRQFHLPEENIYRKIVIKDNILIGVMLVGKIERAGILTGLILNRVDVGNFKEELLRDDFGLINLPLEVRKKMLTTNP
jgi:NAD(P)H-nitrite reductase large subunit